MAEDQTERGVDRSLRDGLRVSKASLAWTVAAGTGAIAVGVIGGSLVLVTFGLIGLLDGVGSGSLIVHFRHSQRHEAVSESHERSALLVVTVGMAAIGVGTIAFSSYRLGTHATTDALPPGIALAGVSVLVLAVLATRKRTVAQRIPSHALHADGWLSAMGAVLAVVALAGTGLNAAFGWWWIDPLAAIVVGGGAVGLSAVLARGPDVREPPRPGS
jgi:divalent metal cation (Fe/Co/Zn/Cd) transporter